MPEIDVDGLKSTREALCAAQSALAERAITGRDVDAAPIWVESLQYLINGIDVHRPIGTDGKHGDLHTPTCECEDSNVR